ncbi:T9SS type A sorting domain-containing protein [bacterium]
MRLLSLTIMVLSCTLLIAQPYTTSITADMDWNGWQAAVFENGLITTTAVPAIGGRVMQYDLGDHHSIYHDHSLDGKTYTPVLNNNWYNFGGFKNWPSPQNGPGRWGWPPPPILDYGEYTYDLMKTNYDSAAMRFTSPVEQYRTPDLQFVREMTIYKNTSRVKMRQILINHGSSDQNCGIWDITQAIVNHPDDQDYENFWIYFTINPESVFGEEGVSTQRNSPSWVGEVAPGIYGTEFVPNAQKLFADPDQGWICYVDELEGVAYAKTFPIFEDKSYPDDEARIAVYNAGNYVEVEVMGPVEDIPANGGQIEFTIDWWAAKVFGPILHVNNVCAVNQFLTLAAGTLSGNYGVFHVGQVKSTFLDDAGLVIEEGQEMDVTPLENVAYSESVSIPEATARIELRIYTPEGAMIGTLDGADLDALTNVEASEYAKIASFELQQNYPNPFNPTTQIAYHLDTPGRVQLVVYDVTGRIIRLISDEMQNQGNYIRTWNSLDSQGHEVPAGIYLYHMRFVDSVNKVHTMTRKMTLIR